MTLIALVTLVNQLAQGAIRLGMNFQEIAELQRKAEAEGRELRAEDFAHLRERAREKLDALERAIEEAEQADETERR